jgi:hypothetical protein
LSGSKNPAMAGFLLLTALRRVHCSRESWLGPFAALTRICFGAIQLALETSVFVLEPIDVAVVSCSVQCGSEPWNCREWTAQTGGPKEAQLDHNRFDHEVQWS